MRRSPEFWQNQTRTRAILNQERVFFGNNRKAAKAENKRILKASIDQLPSPDEVKLSLQSLVTETFE